MTQSPRRLIQTVDGQWVVQDTHALSSFFPNYQWEKMTPLDGPTPGFAWTIDLNDGRNQEWQPREHYTHAYLQLISQAEGNVATPDRWELRVWSYRPMEGFESLDLLEHLLDLSKPNLTVPVSFNELMLLPDIAREAGRNASMKNTFSVTLAQVPYTINSVRITPFGNIVFDISSTRGNTEIILETDLENRTLLVTHPDRGTRTTMLPGPWPTNLTQPAEINTYIRSGRWQTDHHLHALIKSI